MGLKCNIDRRGKVARLIWGLLLLVAGITMLIKVARPSGSAWAWTATLVCLAGGAFAIFESAVGWCVVRALGLKTPM
jgi:hypothetical protein